MKIISINFPAKLKKSDIFKSILDKHKSSYGETKNGKYLKAYFLVKKSESKNNIESYFDNITKFIL